MDYDGDGDETVKSWNEDLNIDITSNGNKVIRSKLVIVKMENVLEKYKRTNWCRRYFFDMLK